MSTTPPPGPRPQPRRCAPAPTPPDGAGPLAGEFYACVEVYADPAAPYPTVVLSALGRPGEWVSLTGPGALGFRQGLRYRLTAEAGHG